MNQATGMKESKHKKITYCKSPSYEISRKDMSLETEDWSVIVRGL